jgi:hypothetical protein
VAPINALLRAGANNDHGRIVLLPAASASDEVRAGRGH